MWPTLFKDYWLDNPEFKDWIEKVDNCTSKARCKVCRKTIDLSNMGTRALKSHAKGLRHKDLVKNAKQPRKSLFTVAAPSSENSAASSPSMNVSQIEKTAKTSLFDYPTESKDSRKAEILYALHAVMHHHSARSNDKSGELFKKMFWDSKIAKGYSMHRTKMGYLINFGIALAFKETLLTQLRNATCITVMFDETFNKVFKLEQFDVHVRFWSAGSVKTRYITSEFVDNTTAEALKTTVKNVTSDLNARNIVQYGMDGPNVNIKLSKLLEEDRAQEDLPSVIEIGTCSLHIVHGGLQTGSFIKAFIITLHILTRS